MATATQLLDVARSQIGVKESPANSNNQKYGIWYGMNYQPWCDMFVSWCAAQVGQSDIGKFAYCPYHVNHFKQNGEWLGRVRPQPGDIVFFANGNTACHVGIVESVQSDISYTSIEGNTSTSSNDNGGAVMRRSRTFGTVGSSWYTLGFARPKYDSGQGWQHDDKGWWRNSDGSYPKSSWEIVDGYWYYFDKEGYAVTNWQFINGHWFYFRTTDDPVCSMYVGWLFDGKYWYYMRRYEAGDNPAGSMIAGETVMIDGKVYGFDKDGRTYDGIKPDGELYIKVDAR